MTEKELKEAVFRAYHADHSGPANRLRRPQVDRVLAVLGQVVAAGLEAGESMALPGRLGKLVVVPVAARKGRHPKTGEEISIPSRRRLTFRPNYHLEDRVNSRPEGGE